MCLCTFIFALGIEVVVLCPLPRRIAMCRLLTLAVTVLRIERLNLRLA